MPLTSQTKSHLRSALGNAAAAVEVQAILEGQNTYTQSAASAVVTNTVSETNFDKSFVIKKNTLKVGTKIKVRAQAIAPSTNATDTLNLKLKFGNTVIVATGALDVANNDIGVIDFEVTIRTIGAGGTMVGAGWVAIGAAGTITGKAQFLASTAIDTTADITVAVSATWSVANAANQARLDVFHAEVIPPALAA